MKERNLDKFLLKLARTSNEYIFEVFNSSLNGLTEVQVEEARERYGNNEITHEKNDSFIKRFIDAFINPFTVVLLVLALISMFTDIIIPQEGEKNFTTVLIIFIMVTISGVIRFIQESR